MSNKLEVSTALAKGCNLAATVVANKVTYGATALNSNGKQCPHLAAVLNSAGVILAVTVAAQNTMLGGARGKGATPLTRSKTSHQRVTPKLGMAG